jgi:DNA-binding LacI/PurR family transcriptional regulator
VGVSIRDVARESGVSPATVSRVLRGHSGVSESAKRRVLAAARKLRYHIDSHSLDSPKGYKPIIVLLFPSISNPFYGELAEGVEQVARMLGYHLVIVNTGNDTNYQSEVMGDLYDQGVEGFLVAGNAAFDTHIHDLVHIGYPLVVLGREAVELDVHCVVNDDFRGSILGTNHLIENGHKNIAAIMMPRPLGNIERIRGYKTAMEIAGLENYIRIVEIQNESIEEGYQAALSLIHEGNVTGIFAYNDIIAVGVLRACRELHKKVPEDISVIGYDGTILSTVTDPLLTTIVQPTREIGSAGIKLLHELITSEVQSLRKLVLQPCLKLGASTAKLDRV